MGLKNDYLEENYTSSVLSVVVRVCIGVINTTTKIDLEKGLISSFSLHHPGKSRQEPRGWGHGGIFLPGLLPMVFPACFLIVPRTTIPRDDTAHGGLGPSTQSSKHCLDFMLSPVLKLVSPR